MMKFSENKLSGLMSGFFSTQEIRLCTGASPNLINEAEFFLQDHSNDKVLKQALHYFDPRFPRNFAPQGSREAAGGNSLVQRRKSPTREELAQKGAKATTRAKKQRLKQWGYLFKKVKAHRGENVRYELAPKPLPFEPINLNWQHDPMGCLNAHGFVQNAPVMARLFHRGWSNEWRIRLQAQSRPSTMPPAQSGDRFTDKLTDGAVRKVFESGAYVQALRGGYTTFGTLTFTEEQREKILTSKPQSKNRIKPGVRGTIVVMSPHSREPYRIKASGLFSWLDDMGKEGELAAINQEAIKPTGEVDDFGRKIFDIGDPSIRASGPWTKIRAYHPDSSIGTEVSRFIDLAQKMYQRGWTPDYMPVRVKRGQERVKPAGTKCGNVIADGSFTPIRRGDCKDKIIQHPRCKQIKKDVFKIGAVPLDYCWVAEMPANEDGEPNPHVHILLRWQVPKTHFFAWVGRLERIWGNGFAKIERIKHAKAGASYLVKAVGYAAKGSDGNQGLIRGNRYGIGAVSRAKGWKEMGSFIADNMAAIIAECEEKLARSNAHYNAVVMYSQIKLNKAKKYYQINKNNKKLTAEIKAQRAEKLTARMLECDKAITEAKDAKRQRGVIAVGHYQITFMGDNATQKFDDFLGWAFNNRQWQANTRNEAIKVELEQNKAALVEVMKEEHAALQDNLDITDQQLERLAYLDNRLDNVHKDINYARLSRLRMANTLKQQRSYWRHYSSTLSEKRSSLDYWTSFLNRYELETDCDDWDTCMTIVHENDLGCINKNNRMPVF
ncbi:hypothetical protein CZ809_00937 [Photobacterium piscicola]|uniref:Uncharacterized protein n=1 Tax=Photobacterium piscicola TaxID=1378299 RepID=A0A1T5HXB9_9GAMM|nr:hypothetical protein [Photobacterium piscicola]SKC31459.1 hypothetical protein CZ809_00937 [Photobacterium piscicola]